MKKLVMMFAISVGAAGCAPTVQESLALSCSDYIGKPISHRIAALGPPRTVYRIDPMQVGYIFESRETTFIGGEPYYTVNYLVGADKHRTPIRPVTTTCTGVVFVTRAPSNATPVSQRIIVDVIAR